MKVRVVQLRFMAAIFAIMFVPKALRAQPFEALYAFGDNYTALVGGPYFQGRWCNGLVWSEHLAARLSLPNQARNNRAAGVATARAVLAQAQGLTAGNLENSLCVVFAGAIDFGSYFGPDPTAAGWSSVAANVLANSVDIIRTLHGKGARTITILNQPDFMRFPQFATLSPSEKTFFRGRLIEFNAALDSAMSELERSLPALRLRIVDLFTLFDTVLDRAETYAFTETSISAVHDPRLTNQTFDGPGRNYAFWDPVAVTTKMHALIANWTDAALLGTALSITRIDGEWALSAERLLLGKTYTLQSSTDARLWTDLRTEQALFFSGDLLTPAASAAHVQLFRLQYLEVHAIALRNQTSR